MRAGDLNVNFVNSLITEDAAKDKLHLDGVRHGVGLDHELVVDLHDVLRPLHPALLRPSDLLIVHKEFNVHIDSFCIFPPGNFFAGDDGGSVISALTIGNACDDVEVVLNVAIDIVSVGLQLPNITILLAVLSWRLAVDENFIPFALDVVGLSLKLFDFSHLFLFDLLVKFVEEVEF